MLTKLKSHLGAPVPSSFFLLPRVSLGGRADFRALLSCCWVSVVQDVLCSGAGVELDKSSGHVGSTEEGGPGWPLANWERLPCGDDTESALEAEDGSGVGSGEGALEEAVACALAQTDQASDDRGTPSHLDGLVLNSHIPPSLTTPSECTWPLPHHFLLHHLVVFSLYHFLESEMLLFLSSSLCHLPSARIQAY